MKKESKSSFSGVVTPALEKRRKCVELAASVGLLLVLAAMMVPFFRSLPTAIGDAAKWFYAVGALVYTVARVVNVNAPDDSLRLRRLRRLEFWAGMSFIVGAAFWFYKLNYYSGLMVGPLAVMQQTVAFTMAGAVIQIVAGWMISSRMKKEYNERKEK
ncbi:MAG: hypothetical protein K2G13_02375 [Muribaculaceae bacterium]|nr:hypothetical protein [Muribaculaceae bacterium]